MTARRVFYLIDLETLTDVQRQKVIESPDNHLRRVISEVGSEIKVYGIPAGECIMKRVSHHHVDLVRAGIRE
jgi:hypothetical protein